MNTKSKFAGTFGKTAAAVLVALVAGLSSAHAYVLDTKIGEKDLGNSSVQDELDAIRFFSGDNSLVLGVKVDVNTSNTALVDTSVPGQWHINVGSSTPGYFLLKFGNGNSSFPDTYFFKNIGELNELVFSNTQVHFLTGGGDCGIGNGGDACNIGRLSHYDTFGGEGGGGSTGSAPEPATLALFGLGMLGFAATRRKARK
jgi:hypothetical protein